MININVRGGSGGNATISNLSSDVSLQNPVREKAPSPFISDARHFHNTMHALQKMNVANITNNSYQGSATAAVISVSGPFCGMVKYSVEPSQGSIHASIASYDEFLESSPNVKVATLNLKEGEKWMVVADKAGKSTNG